MQKYHETARNLLAEHHRVAKPFEIDFLCVPSDYPPNRELSTDQRRRLDIMAVELPAREARAERAERAPRNAIARKPRAPKSFRLPCSYTSPFAPKPKRRARRPY